MAEEKKVPFGGYPREEIQWRRRGLEHVAMNHGVGGSNPSSPTAFQRGKDLYFLPEGRKIMIGIADVKLLNLVCSFLLSKWNRRTECDTMR